MINHCYKLWVVEDRPVWVDSEKELSSAWIDSEGRWKVDIITRDRVLRHLGRVRGEQVEYTVPFDFWRGIVVLVEWWLAFHMSNGKERHVAYQRYGGLARKFMDFCSRLREGK